MEAKDIELKLGSLADKDSEVRNGKFFLLGQDYSLFNLGRWSN